MMGKRFFLIAILVCLGQWVMAQGITDTVFRIQEVRIRAGKMFEKEKAGMRETTVDTTILQEKVNLSLSQLLAENTPVFIKNHGRGALATASFRGTAPSHTQVNWNGMPINNPMTGMVDFSLIPVYIIDDLSLKHGTASIADNSGGLGGSVNISNDVDWDKSWGGRYVQGIGSFGTWEEYLQANGGNKSFQTKSRLYHNYSANDYTYLNRAIASRNPKTGNMEHPLDTNKHAAYKKYGFLQEFYYRPDYHNTFSARWWGQWARRTIPRASSYEGPENANMNRQRNVDHRMMLRWNHIREQSKLEVQSSFSSKHMRYTLKNRVSGRDNPVPAIYSLSRQQSWFNELRYKLDMGNNWSLRASVNADMHRVRTRDTVKLTGYREKRREFSGFVSLHKQWGERLNMKAMLRNDYAGGRRIPLIPYLGLDYRLLEGHNLMLKANAGRNYHIPALNDLYWQPGGNPDLQPEQGISYEAGLAYRKRSTKMRLHAELTGYYSNIRDWIIWLPSYKGYWEPRNIRRVLSRGAEASLTLTGQQGRWGYALNGSYALTSSINLGDPQVWGDQSHGSQLVYIPRHSGNIMASMRYRGYVLTWQYNAYSERYTTSSNDVTRRDWLYPYFMNNLSLGKSWRCNDWKIQARLKINNLLNETYRSVLYRPMPGRNYMLVLMLKK